MGMDPIYAKFQTFLIQEKTKIATNGSLSQEELKKDLIAYFPEGARIGLE